MNASNTGEWVIDAASGRTAPPAPRPPARGRLFMLVFGVTLALGLAFTFLRPAVYQSTATLLVEPPVNDARPLRSDDDDTSVVMPALASAQALATEQQRFLGPEVIDAVAAKFTAELAGHGGDPAETLRGMLKSEFDGRTNLLHLALEGAVPELLNPLLTGWLEAYQAARAASTATARSDTGAELNAQLAALETRIAAQRAELDAYREAHDIVSTDRTENRETAKLRGLNDSINAAEEAELQASARLSAVRDAIARGEPVTQDTDRAAIERLEERVAELRDEVRENDDRYTEKYVQMAPEIMALRKDLAQAERDLDEKKRTATAEVLAKAETELAAARSNKAALLEQQGALRGQLTNFAERFEGFSVLQDKLADLEAQAKPLRERVVQSDVAGGELAATVTVLSPPSVPGRPVRPLYWRDAGISLGVAFVLALGAVLLGEFLLRPPLPDARAPAMPPIYSVNTQLFPPAGALPAAPPPAALPGATIGAPQLAAPPPVALRELTPAEAAALLANADEPTQLAIALLLCGADGEEVVRATWPDLADDGRMLLGTPPRTLDLGALCGALVARLAPTRLSAGPILRHGADTPLTATELAAVLAYVAHDAGLAHPEEVTPAALRHTYFAYLVRQGLKLGELPKIGGALLPSVIATYARYAPPGAGLPLAQVDLRYPALAALAG